MNSNYSTQVQTAELDERGIALNDGWITVYHVHSITREYQSASPEFLMRGVGLPADSYADEPELPPVGKALRRSADGKKWESVSDYRGQTVYSTDTRQLQAVTQFGELPDDVTLLQPKTEFDRWNGTKWITDTDAQRASAINAAQSQLASRKAAAAARINELTYAVNLNIATEAEKVALIAWQRYAVLLSRVDISATAIEWPTVPDEELIATTDQ